MVGWSQFAGLISLVSLAMPAVAAENSVMNLCIRFDKSIPTYSQQLIKEEVLAYQTTLKSTLRFECEDARSVDVRFQQVPSPDHPADALGATRVREGAAQPEIYVFYEPVRMLLPVRLPGVEARALAKVLAHEISHLLSNRHSHRAYGLDAAVFSAGYLLSAPARN